MIGSSLAHFRIVATLGAGGMGEVYQAEDTRLERQVAIKVLPEAVAGDAERLARFEREARVLASLNHPGIAAIYSLEETVRTDGRAVRFVVMELVEGEELTQSISRGHLPVAEALAIARDIAEALVAAHGRGIVHRDLKPANIKITPDGRVKVLDFGLARRRPPATEVHGDSPTQSLAGLTRDGQLIGTAPYMSPEQIRGDLVDERSDLFSLGVILFEMLAGRRPFGGDTAADLLSSILKDAPPDLSLLRPDVPDEAVELVVSCLAKDREQRIASASALSTRLSELCAKLKAALERSAGDESSPTTGTRPALHRRALAVLPFANLSGTEEAELLAMGLHNDLITELSRVPGLTVISRTSVMGYRDSSRPVVEIGRELGVGTLIGGTVQSAGNRVRLTAQLVDAVSDAQQWAERYDRELSAEGLFDLQTDVARRIVESLQSQLAPRLEIPECTLHTGNMDAYRLYTLGRAQLDRRTEAGCQRAVEHFEQALAEDAHYALAWVGLADALGLAASYGYERSEALLARCRDAATRALDLAPQLAEAHASIGLYHAVIQDGPACLRELELAVQLKPSYAEAHNWLGYYQLLMNRAPSALGSARRAVELDPRSAEAVANYALALLADGDPMRALAEARRSEELSPGWTTARLVEGLAQYRLQRFEEARSVLTGLDVEWTGQGAQVTLALACVGLGDVDQARIILDAMDGDRDPFAVGLVVLGLGEAGAAFDWFARVEKLSDWPCLAVHHLYEPVWAAVCEQNRYRDLVGRAYVSWNMTPPKG